MSLLSKASNRLSQLEIDVSKDWHGRSIKNLGDAVDNNDAVNKTQAILQSAMTSKGDILYRGNSEAVRLAASYGVGYNFLHMRNGGLFEPEWLDIQSLIIYLTGAVNRAVVPPTLNIQSPLLALEINEDNSGGGFEDSRSLSIPETVLTLETNEDHTGGGQDAEPVLPIPVATISVTAELV